MSAHYSAEGDAGAATLTRCDPAPTSNQSDAAPDVMRLSDAIARVEPTWVEAVAVVHAVCAQLDAGRAAPALDDVMLSQSGVVSFTPTGAADPEAVVRGMGRLLTGILRRGDCPMAVWEATETARRSPSTFASARAFGASLTCFPAEQGPRELAAYFQSSRRLVTNPARPATALFGLGRLSARAGFVILAVSLGGVGAGMSVGPVLATRAVPPASAPASAGAVSITRLDPTRTPLDTTSAPSPLK